VLLDHTSTKRRDRRGHIRLEVRYWFRIPTERFPFLNSGRAVKRMLAWSRRAVVQRCLQ